MAVSSTTAAAYITGSGSGSGHNFTLLNVKKCSVIASNSIRFPLRPRRFSVRSSSEVSTETTSTDENTEDSVEVPEGPPSLISALNVERALRGIAITDVDHYGTLGIQRGSSYDQVTEAYKKKVEEVTKEGLEEEEEELNKKLELLKESYTMLSSVEDKRLYDWSLARTEKPDRYVWPFEVDITQTTTQNPPPQEPEDVGPTSLVGSFMLG